jgi:HEAT repeat protein
MAYDPASLDKPFEILKAFDWGGDTAAFQPIDAAVVAAHADPAARADLEKRLASLLGAGTSRAAKEYVCRKLSLIGTAASVPSLAALLPEKEHSHMARFALERIPAAEAAEALRKALGAAQGDLKIGMISSLAGRGDAASVPAIAALLSGDSRTAVAAADGLGRIHTPEACQALAAASGVTDKAALAAIADARLACAESLLRQGKRAEAKAIYTSLADAAAKAGATPAAKATRLAASRGILACLDTTTPS